MFYNARFITFISKKASVSLLKLSMGVAVVLVREPHYHGWRQLHLESPMFTFLKVSHFICHIGVYGLTRSLSRIDLTTFGLWVKQSNDSIIQYLLTNVNLHSQAKLRIIVVYVVQTLVIMLRALCYTSDLVWSQAAAQISTRDFSWCSSVLWCSYDGLHKLPGHLKCQES